MIDRPAQWFLDEIRRGLAALAVLSLDGTPAMDVLAEATPKVWAAALWGGRAWEQERDVPRIRAAFRMIAASALRWPAPRQLAEALPTERPRAALPAPRSPEREAAALAALNALGARLGFTRGAGMRVELDGQEAGKEGA